MANKMLEREDTLDKALDVILDEAADVANENIGRKLFEPKEPIAFSKEHEKKMQKLFRKEKNKLLRKKVSKFAKIAAIFFLIIAIGTGATIFSVEAWRVKFLNFVFDSESSNTDYNFSDTGGTTYSDDTIVLDYIPMGFELTGNYTAKSSIHMDFSKGNDYFQIVINDINKNSSIDTENGTVEKIMINNKYEGLYISNPNINAVIWHNNEYSFRVLGNISKEEIIKIAENVKKL